MLGQKIIDIKKCMHLMLSEDAFDAWELSDAKIIHPISYEVDGHLPEGGCISYEQVRPVCFAMMKGKTLPKYFRFCFLLPKESYGTFFAASDMTDASEEVSNLTMNLVYNDGELVLTSSVSRMTFSLDKSIEDAWDRYILMLFRQMEIAMESAI